MNTTYLTQPLPWFIAGPLIGLMVPLLLFAGNKIFGVSSSFRHIIAALSRTKISYFNYDWKSEIWNLYLIGGIIIGGFIAGYALNDPDPVAISGNALTDISKLGITDHSGLIPKEVFNFSALLSLKGFLLIIAGGFLVGFGTRYAGGCTSGHTISGLSNLQFASLVATCCFFAGGLIMTWFILPYLMNL